MDWLTNAFNKEMGIVLIEKVKKEGIGKSAKSAFGEDEKVLIFY